MDLLLEAIGSAIGYGFVGLLIALAIKAFRRSKPLPKWPIITFAIIGVLVRVGMATVIANNPN